MDAALNSGWGGKTEIASSVSTPVPLSDLVSIHLNPQVCDMYIVGAEITSTSAWREMADAGFFADGRRLSAVMGPRRRRRAAAAAAKLRRGTSAGRARSGSSSDELSQWPPVRRAALVADAGRREEPWLSLRGVAVCKGLATLLHRLNAPPAALSATEAAAAAAATALPPPPPPGRRWGWWRRHASR